MKKNGSYFYAVPQEGKRVFGVMLISAGCLLLVRLLGPLKLEWDFSIQLEAAYRFVQGLGLTNAFSPQFNLNQPPLSQPLIHYPPGLSLLVAVLLYLQIPLVTALKIIYGFTTLVGWVCWSYFSAYCLAKPIRLIAKFVPVNLILAGILPLFYTPSWTNMGTDIFLWTGVPLTMVLLVYPKHNCIRGGLTFTAGAVFGLMMLLRYASAFLLPAALLFIIYADFPRLKAIFTRCCVLISPLLISAAFVALYKQDALIEKFRNSQLIGQLLQTHSANRFDQSSLQSIWESLGTLFSSFSRLYYLTGIHAGEVSERLLKPITNNITANSILSGLFIIATICLIALIIERCRDYPKTLDEDILMAIACMLIAFLLFAFLLTFLIAYSPLAIGRYYAPIQVGFILLLYKIITLPAFNRILKIAAKGVIFFFLIFNLIIKPIGFFYLYGAEAPLAVLLAWGSPEASTISFPSNSVVSPYQASIDFLVQAEQENPQALFFVQKYPQYMPYINFKDPLKVRRIPDSPFWEEAFLSEPTKIFWVIKREVCESICGSPGNFNSDSSDIPIAQLASLPNLKTVFTSPAEQTVIMVSDLPAGYQFSQ